jgi:hypothetical protein
LDSAERHRLTDFLEVNHKRICFPNGCVEQPLTLRLGLRDFGLQPSEIRLGFELLKEFELKIFCPSSAVPDNQVWSRNEAHKSEYLDPYKNALWIGKPDMRAGFPLTLGC